MDIDLLEQMLAAGQEGAMLRFTLGGAYLKAEMSERAAEHLARAVELDPDYSAAWKLYGKALTEINKPEAAVSAYEQGIETAEARGDIQAAKEMRVFLKRLSR